MTHVNNRQMFLYELKKYLPVHPVCVEIGCYRGDFSEMIIEWLKPWQLVLIDAFEKGGKLYGEELNYINSAYSNFNDYAFITNRFKNNSAISIIPKYSEQAYMDFRRKYFDFVYHDASHLYEDIALGLRHWYSPLKPSGLMCGHDYIEHPDFGVIKAVDEFCKEYNFEMIIFNENGGDYALKRKV